jgi:2-dehydro-3-deoxyphosphogluconate aldolase/(4S)-4-hydroxy-2-oxoglutarate aldolase
MNDVDFVRYVSDHRLFAVVHAGSAERAVRGAEAAIIGGIKLVEVALATPGSYRVISDLRHQYGDRALIGAGSVMAYDQIDRAVKSGAQFVAMPHTNSALLEACRRLRSPAILGALTPTEVAGAWSLGVPLVNVFPAEPLGGPAYLGSLVSRLAGVRLSAAGGVDVDNIQQYFEAGAVAVSVGRSLLAGGDLENENYVAIAERARVMLRLAGLD